MKHRILLITNFFDELDSPDFRFGAYRNTLLPLAINLGKSERFSIKTVANRYIVSKLKAIWDQSRPCGELLTFDTSCLSPQSQNGFIQSYSVSLESEQVDEFSEQMRKTLGENWIPDIILVWETPSRILRSLYPEALVLDIMPGMFARPPYPKMLSLDPVGLYRDCWYNSENIEEFSAPPEQIKSLLDLRDFYNDFFQKWPLKPLFSKCIEPGDTILVPLQISQYFGWKDNTTYSSQNQFVEEILNEITPEKNALITRYTGFMEDPTISEEMLFKLQMRYPQVIYNKSFDAIDNISQYLLPYAGTICSVSSTLGLQAKFFGKRLISPSISHLSYIADGTSVHSINDSSNKNTNAFMAAFLGRTQFLQSRLEREHDYFSEILEEFYKRRKNIGIEKFPDYETVGNQNELLMAASAINAGKRKVSVLLDSVKNDHKQHYYFECQQAINDPKIKIISFDVFDTLISRSVINPTHIFDLTAAYLVKSQDPEIPNFLVRQFAELRKGAERELRKEIDKREDKSSPEEFTIFDIYKKLLSFFFIEDDLLAEKLIAIEQSIEKSVSIPRHIGKDLFLAARRSGKRIILVSDFCHPGSFVEDLLRQCGFFGWEKLYVSSDIGLKKHSGKLFAFISAELGVPPEEFLHFGDNPYGDIAMARKQSWNVRLLPSSLSIIRDLWHKRPYLLPMPDTSIACGTILSQYANRYLSVTNTTKINNKETELIETREEFGYLVVGPIMYFFAQWILRQAKRDGIKQILFFARDSVLPYRILKTTAEKGYVTDINLCYVPVSRKSLAGADIFIPEDALNIRIDEFNRGSTVQELLKERFLIEPEEIDKQACEDLNVKNVATITLGELIPSTLYRLVIASYKAQWPLFQARFDEKRAVLKDALKQWNVDCDKKSIAVDFGYQGSIHKKISSFFKYPLKACFFMTYANTLGRDPIKNAHVFYSSNDMPALKKKNVFLRYNLLLETLINEGKGSVIGYYRGKNGLISTLRDQSISHNHKKAIEEIHKGVILFSEDRFNKNNILDSYSAWEKPAMTVFFSAVMCHPTKQEALLFKDLVFDNGYAGHKPRDFIKEGATGGAVQGGLWPEGIMAIRKQKKQLSNFSSLTRHSDEIRFSWLVRFILKKSISERLFNKFQRNPYAFFFDSKSRMVHILARFLLK